MPNRLCIVNTLRVALLMGIVILMTGCLFEPREAEPPGEEDTSWLVPDDPIKVFANLESGLESLTGTNYERSIGDAFTFIPLPGDAANFPPGTFEGWNKAIEIETMFKLIGDAKSIGVDFKNLKRISSQISFTQYEGSYELTHEDRTGEIFRYLGVARFDLREGSKGWELEKWEDIEASSEAEPTWGYLRGTLKTP